MRRGLILGLASLLALSGLAAGTSARSLAFQPPQTVVGIAIASDTPSGQWYYPSDPAIATSEVYHWLREATPVYVRMPGSQLGLHAYLGPARLAFSDGRGLNFMVFPAFYLAPPASDPGLVVVRYPYPDVVAYAEDHNIVYLHAPALYAWLRRDAWKRQFQPWEYTPAQQRAVGVVLGSQRGKFLVGLFPSAPGSQVCRIPHGGPVSSAALEGTCATYARVFGPATVVTFTETWSNGASQHSWSFTVSKGGMILRSVQSGDIAPQYWR
ncbi:MAG: hypothetical protein M0Z66_05975 [Thermaerobacter sp.]|nr:hypothetical protein [Thermaerobacter sp.]